MTTQKNEGLRVAIDSRFGGTNGIKEVERAAGRSALAVRLEKRSIG